MPINTVTPVKGTPPTWAQAEKTYGAHYYAYSKSLAKANYTEAYANILLPTSVQTNSSEGYSRNAYISLGVCGLMGIDLGLKKTSTRNWYPVCFDSYEKAYGDKSKSFKEFYNDCIAPANASRAIIIVKPVSTSRVHLYIQFKNASGTNVGTTFDKDIDVMVGNLAGSNCQYYRFASMVTDATNQVANDSTYMIGGQFYGLGIFNKSKNAYEACGISTALIESAWEVSTPRMKLEHYTDSESYTIDNWA